MLYGVINFEIFLEGGARDLYRGSVQAFARRYWGKQNHQDNP